ncbi:MAG TPA: hypothetical protein VGK67_05730 [Myxococcales bacterium]|jgi:hypothetical protein
MSDQPSPNPSPNNGEGGHSELDRPKTAFIFVFVLVSVFVLIGVVLAVDQFFKVSVLEEIDAKVNSAENPVLRQLRTEEETKLTRYQWVDQKNGVLRIPLERARERVLAEWAARPQGFVVPPPDTAAAAPAPAPAAPADKPAGKPGGKPSEAPKGAPATPGAKQ